MAAIKLFSLVSITVMFFMTSVLLSGQSGFAPVHLDADGFENTPDTTYIRRIAFLNGKTFEELQADSLNYIIKDAQLYKYSILYFKVIEQHENEFIYEFYRIDDKKYSITKSLNHEVVEKGIIVNKPEPLRIDTIVELDILDYKNVYTIIYSYKSIKTEGWMEFDNKKRKIYGTYKNGEKHGQWYFSGTLCPSFRYDSGKVISYFCPDRETILEHLNLFYDQEYIRCYIQQNEQLIEFYAIKKANPNQTCEKTEKLFLKKNNTFICEGMTSMKPGKGVWEINEKGQMLFTYPNNKIMKYEIDGFGPDFLTLRML